MEQVEIELRKQAEILGNLNLELNKYVEQNQQLSLQIVKLEERIAKKKKMIQQESKDKSIIQEKLIKAEDKKKQLQIEAQGQQNQEQEQTRHVQPEIKRPQFLDKPAKKQQKQQKKEEKPESLYENGDRGEYQPPLLLEQKQESGSDNDENEHEDGDVLESVRKKLEHLGKDGEEDQDD